MLIAQNVVNLLFLSLLCIQSVHSIVSGGDEEIVVTSQSESTQVKTVEPDVHQGHNPTTTTTTTEPEVKGKLNGEESLKPADQIVESTQHVEKPESKESTKRPSEIRQVETTPPGDTVITPETAQVNLQVLPGHQPSESHSGDVNVVEREDNSGQHLDSEETKSHNEPPANQPSESAAESTESTNQISAESPDAVKTNNETDTPQDTQAVINDVITTESVDKPKTVDSELTEKDGVEKPLEEHEVLNVDLSEHDMPVFADWKKEYYEKDTKTNGGANKVYVAEPQVEKQAPPTSTTSGDELRNYASHECGAKVISSNKEASHLQSVLNENKDEYVMQPCTSRKWLVIELCEPVLIRKIDVGNLELFSSNFENFTVFISKTNGGKERPGKDWHSIGTFHAKEERAVQSFNIGQLNLYTTFVKIEISSHYGNEHFCPITIIRVYGVGLDDDDGDDDDSLAQVDDVRQEEAVPTTEAPPTSNNNTDSKGTNSTSNTGVVFPPQPIECYRCYKSLNDVPLYCWPEFYTLHTDTSNESQQAMVVTESKPPDNSQTIKQSQLKDTVDSKPCEADSAPTLSNEKPTDNNKRPITTEDTVKEPAAINNSTITNEQPKVQATPSPKMAGNSFILVTPTAHIESSQVPEVVPSQTVDEITVQDAEDNSIEPSNDQIILPSPPTLAEPPTAAPVEEVASEPSTEPSSTQDVESEHEPAIEEEVVDSLGPTDPPPPAGRYGKRNMAISKLTNQVKELEHNLQVTNSYLEEMSTKYKNQKTDLKKALNHTMMALHNTTQKLLGLEKEHTTLKQIVTQLDLELTSLRSRMEEHESVGLITPLTIGALVLAILISSCRRQNETVNREEIERILVDMPDGPIRRHKRSGSASGVIGHEAIEPVAAKSMKKCKSYASLEYSKTVGGKGEGGASTTPRQPVVKQEGVPQRSQAPPTSTEDDQIEIVSPTTWRTFDTPDLKSVKSKKKKQHRLQKVKASQLIFTNTEEVMELIQEQEKSDQLENGTKHTNSLNHRSRKDQSKYSLHGEHMTSDTYLSNGASSHSITNPTPQRGSGHTPKMKSMTSSCEVKQKSSWLSELFRY